jgi:hypothetical protein
MEYKRDLLPATKKSKLRIIFGIILLVFSIIWISLKLIEDERISTFDWFYVILFTLNGIASVIDGLGYSLERFLGKAFIQIDHDLIRIKQDVFDKEQRAEWNDIVSLDYEPTKLIIQKRDHSILMITLSKLSYSDISEIKEIVFSLARDKEIKQKVG